MIDRSNELDVEIAALEQVEHEVEGIWNNFSMDEKMRNHGLQKRFQTLRRILKGLREFYEWQRTQRLRRV
ncbi:hypothetical protein BH10BDE1_BH10BDE1_28110 [soil metagenome]